MYLKPHTRQLHSVMILTFLTTFLIFLVGQFNTTFNVVELTGVQNEHDSKALLRSGMKNDRHCPKHMLFSIFFVSQPRLRIVCGNGLILHHSWPISWGVSGTAVPPLDAVNPGPPEASAVVTFEITKMRPSTAAGNNPLSEIRMLKKDKTSSSFYNLELQSVMNSEGTRNSLKLWGGLRYGMQHMMNWNQVRLLSLLCGRRSKRIVIKATSFGRVYKKLRATKELSEDQRFDILLGAFGIFSHDLNVLDKRTKLVKVGFLCLAEKTHKKS